ncbi:MAG: hypothetical protein HY444_09950 [Nitrospirae bacterium]|nr:hypothetical protein [Nitrospirota bacterium]
MPIAETGMLLRALVLAGVGFWGTGLPPAYAAPSPPPLADSTATTEFNCSFGMVKGEIQQTCQVPIPTGCVVAHFPGSTRPWTNISKGGNTHCKFDDKATDWKTRITGTCGKCKTGHCSVQFIVKFDCSQRR